MIYLLIVLSSIVIFAESKTSCPDVQPIKNFNLSAYATGVWYETARSTDQYEKQSDCVIFSVKEKDGALIFETSEVIDNKLIIVDGIASQNPNEADIGKLSYIFDGYKINTTILAVDYDKFSIEYGCIYNEADKSVVESLWVASRTKSVDKDTIEEIEKNLASVGMSDEQLHWIHFTEESCNSDTMEIEKALSERLLKRAG